MAYIHCMSFYIQADAADALRIGSGLERILGYLRTRLPAEPGYITTRGMYSLDDPSRTRLVFESEWERWEDLKAHQASRLSEAKVLEEFGQDVKYEDLEVRVFDEVA